MAAGGVLASLLIKLGLDARGVQDGEKVATSSMSRIGKGAKVAFGAAAGAAAIGAAVIVKGAEQMERAAGDYQAATGASREEANAFAKDMNALVGTNATVGRSFEDLASAGTAVAQQFDLSGEAAKQTTADFLAFAKVTRQDATGAVNDFDAALDAFGEPASRAVGLMDQLIASNQKYGTDAGPAAVAALAKMAPALEAMNMGLDDGVALLNLFEAAGMDASKAPTALNKAITLLKPGQDLDDLIAQISAIEDPTLRAQRAVEIFGGRSGTGFANAIQPGIRSLDRFGESAEANVGKATKASDAMVTNGDRVHMFFDRLGADLRGVGAEFGPFLSGVGGLTYALGPIGGKLGGSLIAGMTATMAAPTVMGKFAGLGTLAGSTFGKAFGLAAAAVAIVILGQEVGKVWQQVAEQAGKIQQQTEADITNALGLDELQARGRAVDDAIKALGNDADRALGQIGANVSNFFGLSPNVDLEKVRAGLVQERVEIDAEIERIRTGVRSAAADPVAADLYRSQVDSIEAGQRDLVAALMGDQVKATLGAGLGGVTDWLAGIKGTPREVDETFDDITDSIRSGFGSVKQALQGGSKIIDPETRMKNMRHRLAAAAANLHKAVVVGDPFAISYWEAAVAKQRVNLDRFRSQASRTFGEIKRDLAGKSREGADAAISQADRIRRTFARIGLTSVGRDMIRSWVDGILSARGMVERAGSAVADWLGQFFHGSAVPKVGPLRGFDRHGGQLVRAWADDARGQGGYVRRAGEDIAGEFRPRPSLAMAGIDGGRGGRGGGVTVHIHVGTLVADDGNLRHLALRMERAVDRVQRELNWASLPD